MSKNKNKSKNRKQIITSSCQHSQNASNKSLITSGVAVAMAQRYSGPLPPPDFLAEYEKIVPGAAERLLHLTEEQTQHRLKMENIVIPETMVANQRGQTIAFRLAFFMILVAAYFASKGMEIAAISMCLALGSGIVTTFVTGKKDQNASMKQKAEDVLATKKALEDNTKTKKN